MSKRKPRSRLSERLSDWRLKDLIIKPAAPRLTEADVRAIVAEYTGDEPVTVQWVPDPKVSSCTAVRATFARGRTLDLVVHHHTAGNDVEEVEFRHWPPRSV